MRSRRDMDCLPRKTREGTKRFGTGFVSINALARTSALSAVSCEIPAIWVGPLTCLFADWLMSLHSVHGLIRIKTQGRVTTKYTKHTRG